MCMGIVAMGRIWSLFGDMEWRASLSVIAKITVHLQHDQHRPVILGIDFILCCNALAVVNLP